MPDIVNDNELSLLAAEYVLGTLDANERTRANVLLDVDHQFRGIVRIWERRLGELHLMVEPVEPDAKIWQRVRGKLKNVAPLAVAVPAAAPSPPSPPKSPSPPLKMPAAATMPAPATLDVQPAVAGMPGAHRLAGLIQEVEKISNDAKLAEQKQFAQASSGPELAPPPEPETESPNLAVAEDKDVPAEPPPLEPSEPKSESKSEPGIKAAEVSFQHTMPAAPEAKPTVAELAAKLAPGPIEDGADGPRLVDRVRRGPAGAPVGDSARKTADGSMTRPPRVGLWQSFAAAMLLVALGLGALIASWRYFPERLPAQLRPMAILNLSEVTSSVPRKPVPLAAQFDE